MTIRESALRTHPGPASEPALLPQSDHVPQIAVLHPADVVPQSAALGPDRLSSDSGLRVSSFLPEMTNCELFTNLAHRFASYDEAVVLALLLALDADEEPLRSTAAKLSQIHLDGNLSDDRFRRATDRLVERGLVRTRVYPNRWTEYSVDVATLKHLLDQPLPDAPYMPGLSKQPIGFLTRQAALAASSTSLPRSADPDTASIHLEDQ